MLYNYFGEITCIQFTSDLPLLVDGSHTIFLNAQGFFDGKAQGLQDILNYLRGQAANGIAMEIDQAVRKA